ncbi:hypothetical protein CVT26_007185 [Gymnopilus dilepis]|uniref:PHD-type domain-containing protein n=1 Tax=Gymnopilus dilepis TaxID=231916 RepID=A0A409W096_9AGAR|nr:hypothetical protein CVT26_007185 [Gymnopilus dilepis]
MPLPLLDGQETIQSGHRHRLQVHALGMAAGSLGSPPSSSSTATATSTLAPNTNTTDYHLPARNLPTSSATLNSILTTTTTTTTTSTTATSTATTSTVPQKRKQPHPHPHPQPHPHPAHVGLGIYGYDGPVVSNHSAGIIVHNHAPHLQQHQHQQGFFSPHHPNPHQQHANHTASPRMSATPMVPPPPPPFHSAAPVTPARAHPHPHAHPHAQHQNQNQHQHQHQASPHPSPDSSNDGIDCMCGFTLDDGYSIQCDKCERWCHAVCFGISKEKDSVPDVWLCWVCEPRPLAMQEAARKRRASVVQPTASPNITSSLSATPLNGSGATSGNTPAETGGSAGEDPQVDVEETWKDTYVHISEDIIPSDETRQRLRKQAMNWRGITAVSTPSASASAMTPPPPVAVKELPPQTTYNPLLTLNSNPSVLPPTYGLHTTAPIPSDKLITPYTSSITPSSSYLSDPLNAYAHLGMPKPFVHLLGPPLDVALDSRLVGNYGRFVRSGCRPNAVLRPVLCDKGKGKARGGEEDKENRDQSRQREEEDGRTLGFGVFAIRDLRAGEEVVLGWEWDDGNAVHYLPALLSTPHMFPADRFHLSSLKPSSTFPSPAVAPPPSSTTPTTTTSTSTTPSTAFTSPTTTRSPHELAHLRLQISNILHALSSTFTTCACGGRARDCVLTQMAAFVDGPLGSSSSSGYSNSQDRNSQGGHFNAQYLEPHREKEVDLGPLVGRKRGFKTRERIPNSGGMGGMEMWVDEERGEGGSRRVGGGVGMNTNVNMGMGMGVNGVNGAHGSQGTQGTQQKHPHPHPNGSMGPPPVPPRRSKSPPPSTSTSRVTLTLTPPAETAVEAVKSRKGKERVVDAHEDGHEDGDVEMDVEMEDGSNSTSTTTTIKPPSPPTTLQAPSKTPAEAPPPPPHARPQTSQPPPPDPPDPPPSPPEVAEVKMPPKMRKRWMHDAAERLMRGKGREEGGEGIESGNNFVLVFLVGEANFLVRICAESPTVEPQAASTAAAEAPPPSNQAESPPLQPPPSMASARPSISSLTSLLTPDPTPTLPTPSPASATTSSPPSTSTPSLTTSNNPFPSPSLASFANLSLLSPALAAGIQAQAHTPSAPPPPPTSNLQKLVAQQKVAGYPFPPERVDSPTPARYTDGWTPLKRVGAGDKAEEVQAQAQAEQQKQNGEEPQVVLHVDGRDSIASSSGNTPQPELPPRSAEEVGKVEVVKEVREVGDVDVDVEMADGEGRQIEPDVQPEVDLFTPPAVVLAASSSESKSKSKSAEAADADAYAGSSTQLAPRLDGGHGSTIKDAPRPPPPKSAPIPIPIPSSKSKSTFPPPPSPSPVKPDPHPHPQPDRDLPRGSVSPMGPDMLRRDAQLSPHSFGSSFSAHSRMSSREDGEIVGDSSPPTHPYASPPSFSALGSGIGMGRGPPPPMQRYPPPAPLSPSAPSSTAGSKAGFGPAAAVGKTLNGPSSVSPSPSFARNPPTGPSYYQRIRAGQTDANANAHSNAAAGASSMSVGAPPGPEPPKAPRALRQSMLANRGGPPGGGSGVGSGGAASPGHPNPTPITSSFSRTPSGSHVQLSAPTTPTTGSFSNPNSAQGQHFLPRGPSADRDRERERDQVDRERYPRFGAERERDREGRDGKDAGGKDAVGKDGGAKDGAGKDGGASASATPTPTPSLRDRLDWDTNRYPRGSGSGMRRWGR